MRGLFLLAALLLSCAPLRAETLLMADGSEIKGTLIATESDGYLVAQENGTIRVPKADVKTVQADFYLVLKDGSVLSGNVKDVSAKSISLQTEQGLRQIDRTLVVKLSTAPVNVAPAPAPAPAAQATAPVQLSTAAPQVAASISSATAATTALAATGAQAATVGQAATGVTAATGTPAAVQTAETAVPPPAAPATPPQTTLVQPAPENTVLEVKQEHPPVSQPQAKTAPTRHTEASSKSKTKNWLISAQVGIWKPGYNIKSADTNNETLSIDKLGIAFGGRLMRVLGKGDWQVGMDISLLSLSSKDYGTTVSTVKVSGERLSLLAMAARRAMTFGKDYELFVLGGAGLAKTKLNYNVTPNASVTSTGHSVSESKLQLAAGVEVQKNIDGTLAALGLMLYNSGTKNEILDGSSSLTASLGARLLWAF